MTTEDNNLTLNTKKTKELGSHTPLNIRGSEVVRVSSFKLLGAHITKDLAWHVNTTSLAKKVQKLLYFLQTLKKAQLSPRAQTNTTNALSKAS